MANDPFAAFSVAFPKDPEHAYSVDSVAFGAKVAERYNVEVPSALIDFWSSLGYGYFGSRDLYFFGPSGSEVRDSLFEWNDKDYWSELFPTPAEGGPLFFAETSFGQQLGFVREDGRDIAYLFDTDTMKSYHVADPFQQLFAKTLTKRCPFTDDALYEALNNRFGRIPAGMHFAPIHSLLLGGSNTPDNYHIETPNVHLRTTIAAWEARRRGS